MTIKGILLRFSLVYSSVYIASKILIILAINHLGVLSYFGTSERLFLDIIILAGCTRLVCTVFNKKNGRDFSKDEKITVFWGLLTIDLVLQFILGAVVLSLSRSNFNFGTFKFVDIVGIITFVAFAHAIPIYIILGVAKKSHIKESAMNNRGHG